MSKSSTTTERRFRRVTTHPGEVLREDFMAELGLDAATLAAALRIPTKSIASLIRKDAPAALTPEMALRLEAYFGVSAEMWLGLQQGWDLTQTRAARAAEIRREVRRRAA